VFDDAGVLLVEGDAEMPNSLVPWDAAVAEIQTEYIAVRRCWKCGKVMNDTAAGSAR